MRVFFDPAFDGGAWPGPLAERSAAAGEVWVGTLGLLGIVETALGLGGPVPSQLERAAALVPALRAKEGFWSNSLEIDPLSTATELIHWRDGLMLEAWRGEALSPWLGALASATAGCRPGTADRINAILVRLERHPEAVFERLTLFTPRSQLPRRLAELFAALEAAGARLEEAGPLAPAAQDGDLFAVHQRPSAITGDGTLQLIRPRAPLEAAEEVATFLSMLSDRDGRPILLGADATLDLALRRRALPTLGGGLPTQDDALLQLLPLCLELGWNPADPRRAVELLTLSTSPVPASVGRHLLAALEDWPAVGNAGWNRALDEGLEQIDVERRERLRARLQVLLTPTVPLGGQYPAAEVSRRVEVLRAWMGTRLAIEKDAPEARVRPWADALAQLKLFESLVQLSGTGALNAPQLKRFVDEATRAVGVTAPAPAQAGFTSLSTAASVCGPADLIIWWNFSLESAGRPRGVPLAPEDRSALEGAGIHVPTRTELALRAAAAFRRPFFQARRCLLLVSPRRDVAGEESYPHPLWDEIRVRAGDGAARLERATVLRPRFIAKEREPVRLEFQLTELPAPTRQWKVEPGAVKPRPTESPSSLQSLLGCSLKWVFQYAGKLYPGAVAELPSGFRLYGILAHEILAKVVAEEPVDGDAAEARALELFDAEGPRLAAELFLPGATSEKAHVRSVTGQAARALVGHLRKASLAPVLIEKTLTSPLPDGAALAGTLDLVVKTKAAPHRHAVVDLKFSGRKYAEQLADGTSVQLASYSHLVHEALEPEHEQLPPVSYFILDRSTLEGQGDPILRADRNVGGPGPEEAWKAVLAARQERMSELKAGVVAAPGNPDENGEVIAKSSNTEGVLTVEPPCRYCDYAVLCGRSFPVKMVEG